MHDDRRRKLICDAAGFKLTPPSGQYIADPPAILPIGERDQESLGLSKNVHRRPVESARLSTYVCNDGEAGQSGGESNRDSVRNSSMEGCHTPLAKPDQKNSKQDREEKEHSCGKFHGRLPTCSSRIAVNLISHSPSAKHARRIAQHSWPQEMKTAELARRVPRQRPFPWASRRAKSKSHRQKSA